jgi:mRNA interferase ChpB
MERGDIYFVSLDPASGHEQRGHRPVLIVTTGRFNRWANAPIVVPIPRGGGFARRGGVAVPLDGHGLRTTGFVRCDQPRALDLAARHARFAERVPDAVMDQVLVNLRLLLEP